MIHITKIRDTLKSIPDFLYGERWIRKAVRKRACGTFLGRGLTPCAGLSPAPRSVRKASFPCRPILSPKIEDALKRASLFLCTGGWIWKTVRKRACGTLLGRGLTPRAGLSPALQNVRKASSLRRPILSPKIEDALKRASLFYRLGWIRKASRVAFIDSRRLRFFSAWNVV